MLATMSASSAAKGILGFLHDEEPDLRVFALQTLNDDINTVWTEVASAVDQIETLYEDETFPERELAALVLAKAYYHLQAYNQSMNFALVAGDLFKLNSPGEFEETIISKCIDLWIAVSAHEHSVNKGSKSSKTSASFAFNEAGLTSPTTPFSHSNLPSKSLLSRASTENALLDPSSKLADVGPNGSVSMVQMPDPSTRRALQAVIERLFEVCLRQGKYRQVVGIAMEAKRLDVLGSVIRRAGKDQSQTKGKTISDNTHPAEDLIEYALGICLDVVQERSLRTELLRLILDLLNEIPSPDFFAIAKCVVYLDADEEATMMLRHLVEKGDREAVASAYQIAFDLYDNSTQEFLGKVLKCLPSGEPKKAKKDEEDAQESDALLQKEAHDDEENIPEDQAKIYYNIRSILDGSKTIKLNLEFLYRNNKSDSNILNKVRDSLESRNSIFHTALTFCNAFMNHGTTNDKFFRDNLDWLGKAVNWSKFTATAALGVIHRGNLSQSRKLLEPYLPRGAPTGSIYSQGGALYAYGLIHANHGADALEYLTSQFVDAEEEVIQHGGALGLGIAGMATGSDDILEKLKSVLYADSALNGEAVGLAMGLIMLGTGNERVIEDMIAYSHETSHEKTVRGLAIGIALIMYGRQEGADMVIEGLLADPNATLRYGGILAVAMAYCGTGSNKAVRKLLHTAVSDVNDDVRRVAVMSLGFILFRKPSSVPRMVELLSESYNPHVRYGSAMALGISCAGTGLDEAIDLLEPMLKDPSDFVRQGALIALSMIMVQQNETMNPKAATIRKAFKKVVSDRHEDAMTKFGAALALGIIDAGGRNCTIGLQTQTGNLNMAGIVGMAVFTQYWYWFPFTHFLSLSFSPTSIIGLDHDLQIPAFKFHCSARPSLFDYPPEQEVKAEEGPALVATAILSTTAQAKRRAQKKEKAQRSESMDLDSVPAAKTPGGDADDKMDIDDEKEKKLAEDETNSEDKGDKKEGDSSATTPGTDAKKRNEKEKAGFDMDNMSRILPGQLKYISFPAGRYQPVKKPTGGPMLLVDTTPDEPKTLLEEKLKKVATEKAPLAPGRTAGGASALGARGGISHEQGDPTLQELQDLLRSAGGGNGTTSEPHRDQLVMLADGNDQEEAPLPEPFDYFTDDEGDEAEEESK
ncbi:26S proteasome regulatory subunit rpn2 [Ceratocystis lukuohia]|uniref:26S proteasome regulatory subunit RPN2 n=1 Tax=Ceratocystis lukuohia TaxID=2019550 RepID=A0ABR4MQE4_9PEZI